MLEVTNFDLDHALFQRDSDIILSSILQPRQPGDQPLTLLVGTVPVPLSIMQLVPSITR